MIRLSQLSKEIYRPKDIAFFCWRDNTYITKLGI